jgi:hypothetical protein
MEWLKLADFGEYKHPKGIQLLDALSADALVNFFHSVRGRLLRKFRGIPIFIGHPDDPEFSQKNTKIYGHIVDLKTEENALWISVKWTDTGNELFRNGILRHLSPRWLATSNKDGKLLPRRLLSVGLTNHPNIQCKHILKEGSVCEKFCNEKFRCTGISSVDAAIPLETHSVADASAVECGKYDRCVPPASEKNMTNSGKVGVRNTIQLHTISQTADIGKRDFDKTRCEKILTLVFERMKHFSEKYGDAWIAVKRANPALFQKNF